MLAGPVIASVDRALGPAEDVFTKPAIEFVFRASAFCHFETPKSSINVWQHRRAPPDYEARPPLLVSRLTGSEAKRANGSQRTTGKQKRGKPITLRGRRVITAKDRNCQTGSSTTSCTGNPMAS